MADKQELELVVSIQTGILRDLYKQNLLSELQMNKCMDIIRAQYEKCLLELTKLTTDI